MSNTVPNTPDPMTFITEAVADLGVYAAMWANRGEQPTAAERAAASQAIERIDVTLQRLHRLRSDLVTEIRQSDDATAARVDELLQERGNGAVELPDEQQPGTAWDDTPEHD